MKQAAEGMSRRNFLKGASFGAAAIAASGMIAGCSPSKDDSSKTSSNNASADANVSNWRTAPEPIDESKITETAECDVLVLGLSYAGASAARAAAEAGAKVICIEQQAEDARSFVGQGNFGHINSEFLKSRNVPEVDELDFFNNWQLRSGNRSNAKLCRKYAHEVGSAFDWYIDGLSDAEKETLTIQFFPTDPSYTVSKNLAGLCWHKGIPDQAHQRYGERRS